LHLRMGKMQRDSNISHLAIPTAKRTFTSKLSELFSIWKKGGHGIIILEGKEFARTGKACLFSARARKGRFCRGGEIGRGKVISPGQWTSGKTSLTVYFTGRQNRCVKNGTDRTHLVCGRKKQEKEVSSLKNARKLGFW